mmetsp:Transcript_16364/g.63873  ORF Transcript_16364/g.63873 Transcript_16364/m.63873 type:complete len:374 (-) Transcript_16364:45-1166(-)
MDQRRPQGRAKEVQAHYNAHKDQGRMGRRNSTIFRMRNTNNWIKSVLIDTFAKKTMEDGTQSAMANPRNQPPYGRGLPSPVVLDMCCGKLGDLQKWANSGICYLVGADIARKSLEDAVERYNNSKNASFPARLISADCCGVDLVPHLGEGIAFDICSCQFALHYSFETEERARQLLHNVSSRLRVGGYFIGTIPNASRIVKRLRHGKKLEFGNSIYKIRFPSMHDPLPGQPPLSAEEEAKAVEELEMTPFGCEYRFTLDGAVQDCPEYLVHKRVLVDLAAEFGMEIELFERSHLFFEERRKDSHYGKLITRMQALDDRIMPGYQTISADEWEGIDLYMVFAFKKVSGDVTENKMPLPTQATRLSPSDIIDVTF